MSFLGYEWYNDFSMWPTYLIGLVCYFSVLVAAIVLHEIGHWFYFKRIGKNMKVRFVYHNLFSMQLETGTLEDYKDMSDDDYLTSLWFGVLSGIIPIVIAGFIFYPILFMVIPYGVGCWSDLKEIDRVYKNRGQNFLDIDNE